MIKSIEIKNFKSIKSKYFPLRNLNVLLGLNGQGKSSFIQSLLLLRQSNIESGKVKGWLDLRGKYINLGNSKDAFYQYAKNECLEFNLQLNGDFNICFQYKYGVEKDALPPNNKLDFEKKIKESESNSGLFSDKFQYLNASRVKPESTYPKNNSEVVRLKNIGSDGRYAVHFIETFYDDEIAFENVLHPKSFIKDNITNKVLVDKTLINQVNLWLGEISPGINVRTTSINQDEVLLEYVYNQPTYGSTNRFKPENVGFGITYSLPVIVSLLKASPGSLIIIENPESHVHPRGQAELGRLISLVAQNDVQIIIETHSDHIMNGIRVGVKGKYLEKDKVSFFYFKKVVKEQEQYSEITDIELSKEGVLSEEPDGLLDEWAHQLLKLL